jgi:hypothetical protein
MNEQVVRGHWLTGGVKFMRTRYAADTNERLLGALPRPLRAQLAEIQPVGWYPRSHHVEMLKAMVSTHADEGAAFDSLLGYGQLVGTDQANGSLRPLMQVVTPKLMARKLSQLWASEHREGGSLESDIAEVDRGRLSLRLSSVAAYDHVGVAMLGWVKGLLGALGCRDLQVQQTGWGLSQPGPGELRGEVRWT